MYMYHLIKQKKFFCLMLAILLICGITLSPFASGANPSEQIMADEDSDRILLDHSAEIAFVEHISGQEITTIDAAALELIMGAVSLQLRGEISQTPNLEPLRSEIADAMVHWEWSSANRGRNYILNKTEPQIGGSEWTFKCENKL